jgi:hypothetical protein
MASSFAFAGFSFPRHIPRLVKPGDCGLPAPLARGAGKRHRFKANTSYYVSPAPNSDGTSFYLDSDFAPGLRWQWCDEVAGTRIDHTGWWTDEFGDGDTIRGIVMRLPHGRGFLAGHSMGESMASTVEYRVYDDECEAARAADRLAEIYAEAERDYRAKQEAEDSNA